MCPHVANHGLGQPLGSGPFPDSDPSPWYATNQFTSEMIFHARMENHPLRTWDPARADLFYVPFYGGLHASSQFREMNLTARDELAVGLFEFLESQYTWRESNGKNHFIVLGRTEWDFMRTDSGSRSGANSLLNMPRVRSMIVMTVERNPWREKETEKHQGIPYPSYFHPSTSAQMLTWQNRMRATTRSYLFSFIGATRKGLKKAAIRDELINQCSESTRCELVKCDGKDRYNRCYRPEEVIKVMSRSDFCLQAPGDSFTRRSTFDAILSGCVPVFFSPHTAYTQYEWFLPVEAEEYSVFVEDERVRRGEVKVEEVLMKIEKERVARMRQTVIELIPRVTYMHPNASDDAFDDVVDVALEALFKLVNLMKMTNVA